MRVVYVTHFKAGTFTGEPTGAESRQTTLVGDFGQRVRLIHKLRKRIGAKECVDYRGNGFRVDQVDGCEDFIVAHVHPFADNTCHTVQPYPELGI